MIVIAVIAILLSAAAVHRDFRAVYLIAALVVAIMGIVDLSMATPPEPEQFTPMPLPNVPRF